MKTNQGQAGAFHFGISREIGRLIYVLLSSKLREVLYQSCYAEIGCPSRSHIKFLPPSSGLHLPNMLQ
ncbi:hypothetical protein AgCh_018719 [Apium graveolens]